MICACNSHIKTRQTEKPIIQQILAKIPVNKAQNRNSIQCKNCSKDTKHVCTGRCYARLCMRCTGGVAVDEWGPAFRDNRKQNKKTCLQCNRINKVFPSSSQDLPSCLRLKWESGAYSYGLIISVDREPVTATLLKVDPYLLEGVRWARQGS